MTKALKFTLLVTIFLIPIISSFQGFGYEHSKALFFIFLTSLSGFLWLGRGFKWSGISKASGIFILILLVTSLAGIDPKISLLGADPYFQGWIMYAYLWLFSLMVATTAVKQKDWIKTLSLSSALVSLAASRQFIEINFLGQYLPTYAGRVVSTFGQPNFYGGFILLCLPFFYFLLSKKGDGNKDGKINLVDMSVLLTDFNKETGFRESIDMNGDGKINTFDFSLMRKQLIDLKVIKGQ